MLKWNHLDYDLILVNINRNVIEELIPLFKSRKGKVLLSGFLETDYEEIKSLCQKYHFQVKEKMIKGEWICITIL